MESPQIKSPNLPNGDSSTPTSIPDSIPNSKSAPKEAFVYRQDLVQLKSRPGLIGIVTEVAGEYDSDASVSLESDISDDEEDEEEEEEEDKTRTDLKADGKKDESESGDRRKDYSDSDSLPDGQIRVSWLDHTFSSEDLSSVTVIDRAFLHGDIITSVSEPSGQLGQVTDIHISVDLLCPDSNKTLKSVSSHDLKRVREFTEGDFVISNCWLGRIDEVLDNVTVLFDDGSVCKVIRADPLRLKPVLKPLVDDVSFPYYPGQRVKAVNSSVFKSQRWLTGLWKASRLEGVVVKVETVAVNVYWIASAYFGPNQLEVPDEEQSPKNLTLISGFSYAGWQFADWCHLAKPIKELTVNDENNGEDNGEDSGGSLDENEVITQQNMVSQQQNNSHENVTAGYRKKLKKVLFRKVDKRARKKEENYEKALEIVRTETKVDVIWQDGTKEYGVDATSLIRIHTPNDHDFLPDQFVVERESEDSSLMKNKRVGLVKSVNAKDRTVLVRWLKDFGLEASSAGETEMVSVYELELHPDYDYCYGDVVVRLPPVSNDSDCANTNDGNNENEKLNEGLNGGSGDAKASASKTEENNEGEDLANNVSWVGNIVGFCDGNIEVVWGDGSKSKVGPHEVYVVGREDDGESFDGGSEGGAASWETVDDGDDDNMITLDREIIIEEDTATTSGNIPDSYSSQIQELPNTSLSPLSMPLAAIGYMTRLAAEFFSRGKKNLPEEFEVPLVERSESEDNEDEEERDEEEERRESVEEGGFKHFDVLQSPGDHHFLESVGNGGGKKWVRKVQQEWNILEKNLPEDIYVRVFEDRMDLIRAVIVGVPGTPYQDGLFFFDFVLPSDFPQVPPTTYYHSGGLRLNPNLYADGKVCLSLLNTWTGKGNEVWDPSTSTILQVLVSIQGLVLNERPYFNEAGYEKQVGTVEGEKNVMPYNENTYLLNLKSMLYLIRKPPLHFEEFVRGHFKTRGYYILKACGAYLDGCAIGSLSSDSRPTQTTADNSCSVGFKLTLTKLLPRLFTALKEVGAECDDFEYLLKNGSDSNNQ